MVRIAASDLAGASADVRARNPDLHTVTERERPAPKRKRRTAEQVRIDRANAERAEDQARAAGKRANLIDLAEERRKRREQRGEADRAARRAKQATAAREAKRRQLARTPGAARARDAAFDRLDEQTPHAIPIPATEDARNLTVAVLGLVGIVLFARGLPQAIWGAAAHGVGAATGGASGGGTTGSNSSSIVPYAPYRPSLAPPSTTGSAPAPPAPPAPTPPLPTWMTNPIIPIVNPRCLADPSLCLPPAPNAACIASGDCASPNG